MNSTQMLRKIVRSAVNEAKAKNKDTVDIANLPDMKKLIKILEKADLLKDSYESKRRIIQQDVDLVVKNLKRTDDIKVSKITAELDDLDLGWREFFGEEY